MIRSCYTRLHRECVRIVLLLTGKCFLLDDMPKLSMTNEVRGCRSICALYVNAATLEKGRKNAYENLSNLPSVLPRQNCVLYP